MIRQLIEIQLDSSCSGTQFIFWQSSVGSKACLSWAGELNSFSGSKCKSLPYSASVFSSNELGVFAYTTEVLFGRFVECPCWHARVTNLKADISLCNSSHSSLQPHSDKTSSSVECLIMRAMGWQHLYESWALVNWQCTVACVVHSQIFFQSLGTFYPQFCTRCVSQVKLTSFLDKISVMSW